MAFSEIFWNLLDQADLRQIFFSCAVILKLCIMDYFAGRGAEGQLVNKKSNQDQLLAQVFFTDQSNHSISLSRTLIGPDIFQGSLQHISCTHPFPFLSKICSASRNNVKIYRDVWRSRFQFSSAKAAKCYKVVCTACDTDKRTFTKPSRIWPTLCATTIAKVIVQFHIYKKNSKMLL